MNNFRERLVKLEDNMNPPRLRNVVINVITEGDDVQPCDGSDVSWGSIVPMPPGDRIHVHFHDEVFGRKEGIVVTEIEIRQQEPLPALPSRQLRQERQSRDGVLQEFLSSGYH